jgi:hypothetical protein
MYNIFYVESPLQMLSALAAYKKFSKDKAILVVKISLGGRVDNDKQILQLIGDEWEQVYIQKERKNNARSLISLLVDVVRLTLKYRGKINRYFYGEYRSVEMAVLRSRLSPKESILLDDGSFTVTAQNYYIRNQVAPYPNSKMYRIFKSFIRNLNTPNLFSFYNLESTLLKDQVNYFDFPVKKEVCIDKSTVYFFGSKLSESGNMHLIDEMELLTKVFKLYEGYNIFYIQHRDESKSKLNEISHLGYQVKNLGKPAEVYFDETNVMPELVVSYYSTVLYTCYFRFKNVKLNSIGIEHILLQEDAKINAKEIYAYYKTLGIHIIAV